MKLLELQINGQKHRVEADSERSLLSILRDDLDLTGTKYGCGEGQCGACTVLIGGRAVRSCLTTAGTVVGKQITTIEGLEQNGKLHPVQEAFLNVCAMQCGYCTAGMIMSGVGLLNKNPQPSEAEITHTMEGNICRCGTHPRVIAALREAAQQPARKVVKGGSR
ncbi:MAG TPA: (2Fe-2S)-binding protein [Blastocatellia bacterium]|nr:(2Fe-2S)-binding protein [Blastocatellia bacterium]